MITLFSPLECIHLHDGHMCDCVQILHHMWEACEYDLSIKTHFQSHYVYYNNEDCLRPGVFHVIRWRWRCCCWLWSSACTRASSSSWACSCSSSATRSPASFSLAPWNTERTSTGQMSYFLCTADNEWVKSTTSHLCLVVWSCLSPPTAGTPTSPQRARL